ncbi:hypothetical protein [Belnapia mucosa]|uniref:hypothetical protein n=1 Tax=Belnapia mucosa TaxID=2804532 RepID=UPI0038B3242A
MPGGTHAPTPRGIDNAKLQQSAGKSLGDLGGAANVSFARIGDTLGLYRFLHVRGPMTCGELAQQAKVQERYLLGWLSCQTASQYLAYNPESGQFSLSPERAMVLSVEDRAAPFI